MKTLLFIAIVFGVGNTGWSETPDTLFVITTGDVQERYLSCADHELGDARPIAQNPWEWEICMSTGKSYQWWIPFPRKQCSFNS